MTKKILALLLALIMVFSLVACGADDAEDEDDDKEKTEENADGDEDEDKDEDDEGDDEKDEDKDDEDDKNDKNDKKDDVPEYEAYDCEDTNSGDGYYVDPFVLYDDGDFTIAVTGITYPDDTYYFAYINLEVTNNTDDDVYFSSMRVYVNGLKIIGGAYVELPAGSTETGELTVYGSEAAENEITAIQSVTASFQAYTMDYDTVMQTDLLTFVTDDSEDYEQKMDFGGEKLMSRAGITVHYLDYEVDDDGDVFINFFVENESGHCIYLYEEEFYVNDMDLSDIGGSGGCVLADGYAGINTISIYTFNYEETDFDPDDIETVKVVYSAWDNDTYQDIIPYTDPETVEFDA